MTRCAGVRRDGERCAAMTVRGSAFCVRHQVDDQPAPPPELAHPDAPVDAAPHGDPPAVVDDPPIDDTQIVHHGGYGRLVPVEHRTVAIALTRRLHRDLPRPSITTRIGVLGVQGALMNIAGTVQQLERRVRIAGSVTAAHVAAVEQVAADVLQLARLTYELAHVEAVEPAA